MTEGTVSVFLMAEYDCIELTDTVKTYVEKESDEFDLATLVKVLA